VADRIVFDSLGSAEGFGLFIRLDSTGNVIWAKEWDYVIDGTLNAALNDGSGFLIGALNAVILWSDGVIIKLDYSGNFLWAKKHGVAGGSNNVALLALLRNQKIAFRSLGITYQVFDPNSNIIYYRSLSFSNFPQGVVNFIQPESDFGLSGTGHRGYALYIFKSDSNFYTCGYTGTSIPGNSAPTINSVSLGDSSLNIDFASFSFISAMFSTTDTMHCFTATAVPDNETSNLIDVYPTFLVDEIIHLNLKDSQPTDLIVTLLDISGRIVYYKKIDSAYGLIQLKLTEQTSGMYLLKLETKEQSAVKKIFISKK
jgi:hypothetical protein